MSDLIGKAGLVTGADGGIGRAIASDLAARGAAVAVLDIDQHGPRVTAHSIGRPQPGRTCDAALTHRLPGSAATGGRMPNKPRREGPSPADRQVPPPYVPIVRRPGDEGSAFRRIAPAEPKAEKQLLGLLGTNAAVVLMYVLLAVVVVVVVVLVIVKR